MTEKHEGHTVTANALVANDGDIVPLRSVRQGEPEHAVKGQGAFEFAYADADMIDAFDCDGLGHCDLPSLRRSVSIYIIFKV